MKIFRQSIVLAIAALFALATLNDTFAQTRNRNADDGDRFLKTAGLAIGDALPDASGYDINGKPFALKDIKGSHAVIVFGCMT